MTAKTQWVAQCGCGAVELTRDTIEDARLSRDYYISTRCGAGPIIRRDITATDTIIEEAHAHPAPL